MHKCIIDLQWLTISTLRGLDVVELFRNFQMKQRSKHHFSPENYIRLKINDIPRISCHFAFMIRIADVMTTD